MRAVFWISLAVLWSNVGIGCLVAGPVADDVEDAQVEEQPPDFVIIPSGLFLMGTAPGEPFAQGDEAQRSVTLTRDFLMQSTEVTQAQWEAVMGTNPSRFAGCAECPVERVNWWDAAQYTNQISAAEGLQQCYVLQGCVGTPGIDFRCQSAQSVGPACDGYRLPTEAEWEYAARAGSLTDFYNGRLQEPTCLDSPLGEVAWYCGSAPERPEEVGQLSPNGFGLFDVHGNVFEWVEDHYGAYAPGDQTDPVGAPSGSQRVLRGGGWFSLSEECRVARRTSDTPHVRISDIGFRPVRTSRGSVLTGR